MKKQNKKGFTLVELLAVIVVLAIILAIAVPSITGLIQNSAKNAFNADAKMILQAIEYRKLENEIFNPLEITKANMTSMLGLSDENYKQIAFLKTGDVIEVEIIGQNKWAGLVAYGTKRSMNVVEIEDYNVILPSINILGDNPSVVGRGSTYIDAGATATDVEEGEILLLSIIIRNEAGDIVDEVDTSSLGTYTITYTAANSRGHEVSAVRRVYVVDKTAPVITLIGDSQLSINKGSTYSDDGVSAVDDIDGDIASNVLVAGYVNPNVVGTYLITYNVSDSAGNAATPVTRTINVVDAASPVITMLGDNPTTVFVGSTYTDAGATAIDDEDGDVTGSIVTTGDVNPNIVGTYTITYTVSDSAGNESIASRTVNVIDVTNPVVTFGMNGNSTYAKSRSTSVTVSDLHSDIDNSSLKYQWTTSATTPVEATFTTSFTNGGTITTPAGVTGSYYLWILGKDASGNTIITRSNVFNLDNIVPVVTGITMTTSGITGTTFTINRSGNGSDANGGLAANPYVYQTSTDRISWTTKCTNNTTTCNVTGLTTNTLYYYRICVNDMAGNQACTNNNSVTPVNGYFCGGLTGDAAPANVLIGKTYYNQVGFQTGTMPSNGSQTATLTISGSTKPTKSVPAGYTTGGTVTAQLNAALASSIKNGVNIGGVAGTFGNDATIAAGNILSGKIGYNGANKITGTMPNRGTVTYTPSTSNQTIAAGYHSGSGYVVGDSDLVAGNIKSGVNLFGVTGTLKSFDPAALLQYNSGQISISTTATSITRNVTISGAQKILSAYIYIRDLENGYFSCYSMIDSNSQYVADPQNSGTVNTPSINGNVISFTSTWDDFRDDPRTGYYQITAVYVK